MQLYSIRNFNQIYSIHNFNRNYSIRNFNQIYLIHNCGNNNLVAQMIPRLVTDIDNNMMSWLPLQDEIKSAVFYLNGDGAPGPDGFGGHFYYSFWEVVGSDVVHSVQEFFQAGVLAPNVNSNLIVLIPKITGSQVMGDYRPIALANFQFKIVTKILADRLAIITMRIISIQKRGFVRERNISNCVILAYEVINLIDRRQFGGNVALKVDIVKAFDTLDWKFLLAVLRQFGFSDVFVDWILAILESSRLSILVNAKAVDLFSCSRGSRQGDPLSPLLFCLAEDVLSCALSDAQSGGTFLLWFMLVGSLSLRIFSTLMMI